MEEDPITVKKVSKLICNLVDSYTAVLGSSTDAFAFPVPLGSWCLLLVSQSSYVARSMAYRSEKIRSWYVGNGIDCQESSDFFDRLCEFSASGSGSQIH